MLQTQTIDLADSQSSRLLKNLARIVATESDLDELLSDAFAAVRSVIGYDRATLNVIDYEAKCFTIRHVFGQPTKHRMEGQTRQLEGTRTNLVAITAKTLIEDDISRNPRFPSDVSSLELGLRSCINVPLIFNGTVVAVMQLQSQEPADYGRQAQAILEWLAGQISASIEIRGLYERLLVSSKELVVVDRTASIITSSNGNLCELLPKVLSEIRKVMNFDRVALTVIDYQSESLVVKYVWGEDLPGANQGEINQLEGSRTQQVALSRKTLVQDDIAADPRFKSDQSFASMGLRSCINLPLVAEGSVVAVIKFHSRLTAAFGPTERRILDRLASQISTLVDDEQISSPRLPSRLTEVEEPAQDDPKATLSTGENDDLAAKWDSPNQSWSDVGRADISEREVDVLKLLTKGASNRQVSVELAISVNTVKTHIKHLMDKLGTNNRTQTALAGKELFESRE